SSFFEMAIAEPRVGPAATTSHRFVGGPPPVPPVPPAPLPSGLPPWPSPPCPSPPAPLDVGPLWVDVVGPAPLDAGGEPVDDDALVSVSLSSPHAIRVEAASSPTAASEIGLAKAPLGLLAASTLIACGD